MLHFHNLVDESENVDSYPLGLRIGHLHFPALRTADQVATLGFRFGFAGRSQWNNLMKGIVYKQKWILLVVASSLIGEPTCILMQILKDSSQNPLTKFDSNKIKASFLDIKYLVCTQYFRRFILYIVG